MRLGLVASRSGNRIRATLEAGGAGVNRSPTSAATIRAAQTLVSRPALPRASPGGYVHELEARRYRRVVRPLPRPVESQGRGRAERPDGEAGAVPGRVRVAPARARGRDVPGDRRRVPDGAARREYRLEARAVRGRAARRRAPARGGARGAGEA